MHWFQFQFQHEKRDVAKALLMEGCDPGILDETQDSAVDLIASPEMRQVFADVLIQAAANGQYVVVVHTIY